MLTAVLAISTTTQEEPVRLMALPEVLGDAQPKRKTPKTKTNRERKTFGILLIVNSPKERPIRSPILDETRVYQAEKSGRP